jgi:predicted ATPase
MPITLLTGLNSSGKSSIIQAIRIINEGKLLDGYGECVSIHSKDEEAKIFVTYDKSDYKIIIGKVKKIKDGNYLKNQNIQYIGADRLGPQLSLPFREEYAASVGDNGIDILSYISQYWSYSGAPEALRMEGYKDFPSVQQQIKAWLNIISPEFEFGFQIEKETDSAFSTYTKNKYRAKDVGFGLSYNLPIIAAVIISAARLEKDKNFNPIIIIENPEAHLHPSGQTKLGKFLSIAASCGVQIIVETHSDHFLNGVRLAVKEQKIKAEAVGIHYFKYDAAEEMSLNTPIHIDKNAMLDEWPEGFFDETEKTLLELL